jgi:hypothetical protein
MRICIQIQRIIIERLWLLFNFYVMNLIKWIIRFIIVNIRISFSEFRRFSPEKSFNLLFLKLQLFVVHYALMMSLHLISRHRWMLVIVLG